MGTHVGRSVPEDPVRRYPRCHPATAQAISSRPILATARQARLPKERSLHSPRSPVAQAPRPCTAGQAGRLYSACAILPLTRNWKTPTYPGRSHRSSRQRLAPAARRGSRGRRSSRTPEAELQGLVGPKGPPRTDRRLAQALPPPNTRTGKAKRAPAVHDGTASARRTKNDDEPSSTRIRVKGFRSLRDVSLDPGP